MQEMLPALEQEQVYHQYHEWNGVWVMDTPYGIKDMNIPVLMCPSDPNAPGTGGGGAIRSKGYGFLGNYAVCAGNDYIKINRPQDAGYQITELNGLYMADRKIKSGAAPDGLSRTLAVSEGVVRPHPGNDPWGELGGYWGGSQHAAFGFTTMETPNSILPDRVYSCKSTSLSYAPCVNVGGNINKCNFARSHHGEGVNAAFGDGSVTFITDDVDRELYHAIGSRNGSEKINWEE